MNIETVLDNYIEAALWSSCDANNDPMDTDHDRSDLAPETIEKMREDVTKFVAENSKQLKTWDHEITTAEEQAGHDFWLTRNRHGVGFWESEWGDVGDELTTAAHAFGECDLYIGDDGLIYC